MPIAADTRARREALNFHLFLGTHSLLIGLLPFYLPVWLWRAGLDLAGLSLTIGVSGFAFAAALAPWRRLAASWPQRQLIRLTLSLEVLLVALVFAVGSDGVAAAPLAVAVLLGVANGAYSAFFWTTQRVLFAASLGRHDAGRRYGNMQIFVTLVLKLGIVAGGLLLDAGGLGWLLASSILLALAADRALGGRRLPDEPLIELGGAPANATTSAAGARTREVFRLDGVFLLLESHFWTLSLFLLFGEDFSRLGFTVVALGIAFAALFWLAKNLIDRIRPAPFYRAAVALYALSWALRALLDDLPGTTTVLIVLVAITFCSSLFRLTFNKRFFEHARAHGTVDYLVWKSELSQRGIGTVFLGIALALALGPEPAEAVLGTSYAIAAWVALAYLLYPAPGPAAGPAVEPTQAPLAGRTAGDTGRDARLGNAERSPAE